MNWIQAKDRYQLCKKVIEQEKSESWISLARGESEYDEFIDFDQVTISFAKFLNSKLYKYLTHPLKVVYLCGLDHFNKCPYVVSLLNEKNIACAVVYRLGAPENRIKDIEKKYPNLYYITLENERETLVDISSTLIRQQYQNSTRKISSKLIYPFVDDFLRNKYHKK